MCREINGFGMVLSKEETEEMLCCWSERMAERSIARYGRVLQARQPIGNFRKFCRFDTELVDEAKLLGMVFRPYEVDRRSQFASIAKNDAALFIPANRPLEAYEGSWEIAREMKKKVGDFLPPAFDVRPHIGELFVLEDD